MPPLPPLLVLLLVLLLAPACTASSPPQLAVLTSSFRSDLVATTTRMWKIPSSLRLPPGQVISCEVIITAVLQEALSGEQFWGSGAGALTCPACMESSLDTEKTPPSMDCIYMTTTGAEVWHQTDIPNTLNVAVACTALAENDPAGQAMCALLAPGRGENQTKPTAVNLTLFPSSFSSESSSSSPSSQSSTTTSTASSLMSSTLSKSLAAAASSSVHRTMALKHATERINRWDPPNLHYLLHNLSTSPRAVSTLISPLSTHSAAVTDTSDDFSTRPDAVCITQTFRNELSGPMLYMSVKHYHTLGWEVLVYDRFGYHSEFMQDFLNASGVHYHPYTAYQLLYPDTYNAQFAKTQSREFKYYSERGGRGFGKDAAQHVLQNNEEGDHDSDRRKTFMLARQQYSPQYFAMIFPDRDEFLFCDVSPNLRDSAHPLQSQKTTQRRHFRMFYHQNNAQSIEISRYAHAARYPLPPRLADTEKPVSPKELKLVHRESNVKVDIQRHLSACLTSGYEARNMVSMWQCFSKAKMMNTKSKSGEVQLPDICPFVGVHKTCVRCKCKEAKSKRCRYVHLNTVYFKPDKVYEKYGDAIYEPLSDMVSLWA